jgi:hypothetical protein
MNRKFVRLVHILRSKAVQNTLSSDTGFCERLGLWYYRLFLQLELQCSGVWEMQSLYHTDINALLFSIYSLLYAK